MGWGPKDTCEGKGAEVGVIWDVGVVTNKEVMRLDTTRLLGGRRRVAAAGIELVSFGLDL